MPRDKYGKFYDMGDFRKNEHLKEHRESKKEERNEHEHNTLPERPEMREHEMSLEGHHEHHKQHNAHHEHHHNVHEMHHERLNDHHDRLKNIEIVLGIHHKADGFKDEDQGGSGKAGAGHVTER